MVVKIQTRKKENNMLLEIHENLPEAKGVLPSEVGKYGPWIAVRMDDGGLYGFWRIDTSYYFSEASENYNKEKNYGN
jgi:hypothetical protein